MSVKTLENVEIFAAGKWNGDVYTEKDLDSMVEAFSETREKLKPYLKLGHSTNQSLLQKDGLPSAGWITGLKRQGKKLLATIENIPEKIYNLIVNKAYGRVSSEIFWNLKLDDKSYSRALKAVALLGADTPEVHELNDFINLYTEEFEAELKEYHHLEDDKEITEEEDIMSENNDRLIQIENELKQYKSELENSNKKLEAIEKENAELKAYSAKIEYEKKVSEITNYLEGQVAEGKITPAQVDYFTALCLDDKEVKAYTNSSNQKIEGKAFDLIKSIIGLSNPVIDLGEKSNHSVIESKVYSKDNPEHMDDELDKKIKEYMKENNVNYAEAFDAVSYEGGQ